MRPLLGFPIRPPAEGEVGVLYWLVRVVFWVVLVALVGLGGVCLFLGYRAPPEKAAEAARAIRLGFEAIGIAVTMYIVRRFFCRCSS
jgi:hypothetical protein